MGLLTTPGSTLDPIDLSQTGHRLMAEMVWKLIEPVLGDGQHSHEQLSDDVGR